MHLFFAYHFLHGWIWLSWLKTKLYKFIHITYQYISYYLHAVEIPCIILNPEPNAAKQFTPRMAVKSLRRGGREREREGFYVCTRGSPHTLTFQCLCMRLDHGSSLNTSRDVSQGFRIAWKVEDGWATSFILFYPREDVTCWNHVLAIACNRCMVVSHRLLKEPRVTWVTVIWVIWVWFCMMLLRRMVHCSRPQQNWRSTPNQAGVRGWIRWVADVWAV